VDAILPHILAPNGGNIRLSAVCRNARGISHSSSDVASKSSRYHTRWMDGWMLMPDALDSITLVLSS
jgi:hypothetical protein